MWTSHEVKLCHTETITVIAPLSVVIPASLDILIFYMY